MNQLEALLRERIARDGPLSFREVMQAALYHPEHGYYTNLRGFGALGDFITSPERHPAFGWLIRTLGAFPVTVDAPKVTLAGDSQATVTFRQGYRSDARTVNSTKTLVMARADGRWLIKQERVGN